MTIDYQDLLLTARDLAENVIAEEPYILDKEGAVASLTDYLVDRAEDWASYDDQDYRYEQVIEDFFNR